MLTLWDLIKPKKSRERRQRSDERGGADRSAAPSRGVVLREKRPSAQSMRAKYERLTAECLSVYGVRVRKWRSSMSGCAWETHHRNGQVSRLIEAPRPRGPMSAAIFLHEIGHHAIGLRRYRPRCLEEHHAWVWAIEEMDRRGLNVTSAVQRRMRESLRYALDKAQRRGLKSIPPELAAYLNG